MLDGFMMWGLRPGPLLFENNRDFVWGLIASLYVAKRSSPDPQHRLHPRARSRAAVPYGILMPLIVVFCVTCAYAQSSKFWDVGQVLIFGVVGYLMRKLDYSRAALVAALALVLGPRAERALRQRLSGSHAGVLVFFQRRLPRP
jgi:putative tricarboxylic transport membrane protein